MRGPIVALIVPLGEGIGGIGGIGGVDPGFGNRPIHHPGHPDHGLPPFPDQGLPGGSGGHPSQGLPPFPDQGLPPGGEDIPSNELPLPEVPADYEDDIVVAIHRPGEDWVVKAYEQDDKPDQGLPPTPAPKGRRG